MKRRSIFFIFCLCLCLPVFAQEKPVAVKITEYDEKAEKAESLTQKTNFFLKKLSETSKTTKGFVAAPLADSMEILYQKVKSIVSQNLELNDRIEFLEPQGVNNKFPEILEFWLIPSGVEKPYYSLPCGLMACPTIEIESSEVVSDKKKLQVFTANIRYGIVDNITYNWQTSAGEIISGQGSPVITVDFSKVETEEVTVILDVGGIPQICKTSDERKIQIVKPK